MGVFGFGVDGLSGGRSGFGFCLPEGRGAVFILVRV